MIFKFRKLYEDKVDLLLAHLQAKFFKPQETLKEVDIHILNIESLDPSRFVDFNSSSNSVLLVLCDEDKLENYCIKLRNVNATLSTNKDIYNLLYTQPIKQTPISTFFRSNTDVYVEEVHTLTLFKERALEYILNYNTLKEKDDSRSQLNYLRLTNFTNNLNETICSLLKLQPIDV